jgi:NAD(P)-dependent dehydrogenase (short-subunit alcohol dehydrogenase family)
MLLKDRIAIITGGSSGIGRGIALEFAREGARIAIADKREVPLRGIYHETDVATPTVEEIEKLGTQGIFVQTDVADESQIAHVLQQTVEHFGGLDILINNAGIHIPGGVQELSIADWDKVVGVNLRGVFVATKLALPHLKQSKFGRIIQIASVHAYGGGAGPAYAPAKSAVVNMVRDTALEIGQFGITVNAICPGYIETAIQDYLTPEQVEEALEKTALLRFGLPRDIGRAAVFFASDDAEWVTGASLLVDGGFAAGV